MRVRWCAGSGLGAVLLLAGCQTGPGPAGDTQAVPGQPFVLAKTPDILTPPKGRYTLRLVFFVKDEAATGQDVARLQAEAIAQALRDKDIPAFLLTRSLPRHGSKTERVPVYYVCVGAFESARTEEAQTVLASFRQMRVKVGADEKPLFQRAEFTILDPGGAGGAEDILALYEMPEGARFALAVGRFNGPKHKELARAYALRLRAQGQKPLIQESDVASLVVIGAAEFPDDPALLALAGQFTAVEHDTLAYITFRGVYERTSDRDRAVAAMHLLKDYGYITFAERLQLQTGLPGPPIFETRVYVVRKDRGNFTVDGLRREFQDIKPYDVRVPEFRPAIVDLMKGAFDVQIVQPPFKAKPPAD